MAKLTREEYDRLKKKYEMRYNWVAKYKDGYVFVYEQKPVKMEDYWYSSDFKTEVDGIKLDFMSFEDEEPYNIKELIDEAEEHARDIEIISNVMVQTIPNPMGFRTLMEGMEQDLFVVPSFQWVYRWTEEQVEELAISLVR